MLKKVKPSNVYGNRNGFGPYEYILTSATSDPSDGVVH